MENLFDKETPLAVLISVRLKDEDERESEASLYELERLLYTAGGERCAEGIAPDGAPAMERTESGDAVFAAESPPGPLRSEAPGLPVACDETQVFFLDFFHHFVIFDYMTKRIRKSTTRF